MLPRWGRDFSLTFRPALGPTHPPVQQWRTERGVWGVQTPPRNSEAWPNSEIRGK
jgi:hypothetical protein